MYQLQAGSGTIPAIDLSEGIEDQFLVPPTDARSVILDLDANVRRAAEGRPVTFTAAWNDFLFAIALTSTDNARTVPAAIAFFTGSSRFELPTGSIAAASVVVTAPIILMVLLFQRRIVTGLTSGAVKG